MGRGSSQGQGYFCQSTYFKELSKLELKDDINGYRRRIFHVKETNCMQERPRENLKSNRDILITTIKQVDSRYSSCWIKEKN